MHESIKYFCLRQGSVKIGSSGFITPINGGNLRRFGPCAVINSRLRNNSSSSTTLTRTRDHGSVSPAAFMETQLLGGTQASKRPSVAGHQMVTMGKDPWSSAEVFMITLYDFNSSFRLSF